MDGVRRAIRPTDLTTLAVGAGVVVAAVCVSATKGPWLGLGGVGVLLLFGATVACFLVAPHLAVALVIPLFAALPAAKVFVSGWVGPSKDVLTMAAAAAVAIRMLGREGRRDASRVDRAILISLGLLLTLYVLDLGSALSGGGRGAGWIQGMRLVGEPLLLLLAGLLLPQPRRTLRWAAISLIATGCGVALFGLAQQAVGPAWLVAHGYSYDAQVRTAHGHFRSFGTLDDPFGYAAFLLLALSTVMFWMRRRGLAVACGALITLGAAAALVQTSAIILGVLVALWLARAGRVTAGMALLAAMIASATAVALTTPTATQTRAVRAGPNTYLTLNGRTTVWKTIFADRGALPLGIGVGKTGTAATRANLGILSVQAGPAVNSTAVAVDSGYFATVADVGLVGLGVLAFLLARLVAAARAGSGRPGEVAGWLALAYLATMGIDALTRDSFTGFPGAFLGLLMVGIALAAKREQDEGHWRSEAVSGSR